jgi:hypothetical protein
MAGFNWGGVTERKLTWEKIWRKVRGTLIRHILSGCPYSLTKGRYKWRHDQVLRELAIALDQEIKKKRVKKQGLTFIHFKKSGEKSQSKEPLKQPY